MCCMCAKLCFCLKLVTCPNELVPRFMASKRRLAQKLRNAPCLEKRYALEAVANFPIPIPDPWCWYIYSNIVRGYHGIHGAPLIYQHHGSVMGLVNDGQGSTVFHLEISAETAATAMNTSSSRSHLLCLSQVVWVNWQIDWPDFLADHQSEMTSSMTRVTSTSVLICFNDIKP